MVSTFHGLETARRGMVTQQSALYTTGHNIANANTPGYTRQRVNFTQTNPYPSPGLNTAKIPGQVGTGVEAGTIQRVRESFLDLQFRGENTKNGYWEARTNAISKMEDILNEPSETGLAKTMDQFWQSLQDLSVNPENKGARAVVAQRGIAVADTFHYLHDSIKGIKQDLGNELSVSLKNVNTILEKIAALNSQISEIEPVGYVPNDLYDQRDMLVDELSKFVEIKVEKRATGGNALDISEGIYDIKLSSGETLVSGSTFNRLAVSPNNGSSDPTIPGDVIQKINIVSSTGTTEINAYELASGKIKALVESYGYEDGSGDTKGLYPQMLDDLDKMAYTFIKEFNAQHQQGWSLDRNGTNSSQTGINFFEPVTDYKGAAKAIAVNQQILNNNDLIAASSEANVSGNGMNAINLAGVKQASLSASPSAGSNGFVSEGTIETFYQGLIGDLGVKGQHARQMETNSAILKDTVEKNRRSVSSVSLDEEMTNMITFQHAYNAAARQITVIDEMLDKIINGMGVVGR
ncbi:flagellar hook-associated protein FlgK [Bacillus sp. JJ1566]|uniref:flagellar hook-associated protein FlgK n=1 Tax=Bacillus sp. JJ1566 TaxID=3122961 RepID=UPI002FFFF572